MTAHGQHVRGRTSLQFKRLASMETMVLGGNEKYAPLWATGTQLGAHA